MQKLRVFVFQKNKWFNKLKSGKLLQHVEPFEPIELFEHQFQLNPRSNLNH